MKNKNVWAMCLPIILLPGFLASTAAAQQSGPPPKPEEGGSSPSATSAVVLKVGATQVTQSEIDTLISGLSPLVKHKIAVEGRRSVGEEYVKTLLLSQQALNDHLDSSATIRWRLELQRAQVLAQAEYEKMLREVKISPEEVSRYFGAHQSEFDMIQVREFLIQKKPKEAGAAKPGLTEEEAKARAESIHKALLAGTDIEKVAEDFAEPGVMLIDRKPRTFRRGQLVPALEKATWDLKDGGVSEPVDTPQAFLVVKVFGHQHPELKDVATEIENKLRQQQLDARVDDLKKKTGVWMDEDYFKAKPVATPASAAQSPASVPSPKP